MGPAAQAQVQLPDCAFFLGRWSRPRQTQMPSPMPASPGLWTPNQTLSGASAPSMRPLSSNHPLPVSHCALPSDLSAVLNSPSSCGRQGPTPTPTPTPGPALLLGSSSRRCTHSLNLTPPDTVNPPLGKDSLGWG